MTQWLKCWLSNARAQVQDLECLCNPNTPTARRKLEAGESPEDGRPARFACTALRGPTSDRVEGKDGYRRLSSDLYIHNVTYAHLRMSHTNTRARTHTSCTNQQTERKENLQLAHTIAQLLKTKVTDNTWNAAREEGWMLSRGKAHKWGWLLLGILNSRRKWQSTTS